MSELTKDKIITGVFVSVWSDGSEIRTPGALNLSTGEVNATMSDTDPDGSLVREYFKDKDGEEYEVCTTCHEYILKTAINPGIGHDLNEEQVCSNPDCNSHND